MRFPVSSILPQTVRNLFFNPKEVRHVRLSIADLLQLHAGTIRQP
jgi:hypothetical protein